MRSSRVEKRLGDVVKLKRGYDLPKNKRKDGSVPVVSSSGSSGTHDVSMVEPPGVVTGRYGTIGKVYYVNQPYWPLNTTLYVRDFKGNDPKYIYYLLQTVDFARCSDKAAVPGVNRNHLHELPIVVTEDEAEQRAIAGVLGSLDDKIELNRRMNRTLESMAECIYAEAFADASRWETRRLDEVTTVSIGRTPPRKEPHWFSEEDSDVPWVSIRDMGNAGMFIVETSERLTHDAVNKFNVRVIPRRTVIVSFKLTVGRVALAGFNLATNEAIAHLPLDKNSGLSEEYLYFALKRFPYETLASTSSIATAVNSSTIRAIPIVLPPIEIVGKFQAMVAPVFEAIERTIHQTRTLEELRDTMLPKLLSGELSLRREQ